MMIKKFICLFFLLFLFLPASAEAAGKVDIFNDVCKQQPQSSVCTDAKNGKTGNPVYGPDGIITKIVNLLSIIVGVAAVIGIIVAGIRFITSGSNPQDANNARELVIYSVLGLLLAAIAQILVRVILNVINV